MDFTRCCHVLNKGLCGGKRVIPAKGIVNIRSQNSASVELRVKICDTGCELQGGPPAEDLGGIGFTKRHGQVYVIFGGA